ncbi:flavin-containing monooxygenase [Sinosporangium siamense]|uniref:Cyclohexanone monooxygenase n=1 Tax=Sinosporangium siamense TaxID=1367973 RepID=A0A919V7B4_9ACTN|nr:NAD(P)/FAD-dependent oxidoreductase [Sinosporangium siamense]GII92911.1 cyclohexanone monooxygenase [Sinosporangium siamense]
MVDERHDVVVIGAGFAGLYATHMLRQKGFTSVTLERGSDVGGTWYWNRYPGARCDIESLFYTYSWCEELNEEWNWSERYPAQAELLSYARAVADRYGLWDNIRLDTEVVSAVYQPDKAEWVTRTSSGSVIRSKYLVAATGCLSAARPVEWPGMQHFDGKVVRTSDWPEDGVDVSGMNVAVVGTGSSGIQVIPELARSASRLTVLQRTPNFSMPARNRPLLPAEVAAFRVESARIRESAKHHPSGYDTNVTGLNLVDQRPEDVQKELTRRWESGGSALVWAYADVLVDKRANEIAAKFIRDKIRAIVDDPAVADRLTPWDHALGTKRPCVDTNYYQTFNRPNVEVVDLRQEPISGFGARSVELAGRSIDLDVLVLATGFQAFTGSLDRMQIVGADRISLREKWEDGPKTFLGVAVSGFPNFFMITGPGSPSVFSNMMVSIEQHVEWIVDMIESLRDEGASAVMVSEEEEAKWVAHVDAVASQTLFAQHDSWYVRYGRSGNRVFMPYLGGVGEFRRLSDEVAGRGYKEFIRLRAPESISDLSVRS